MPEVHLYGGPCSGQVVHISGWPPTVTVAHAEPVLAHPDLSISPYIPVTYENYIRVTQWPGNRSRYVHADIYPMMRFGL